MRKIREKVFTVIQPAASGDRISRLFDLFITLLVLLSVTSVFAATFALNDFWTGVCRRLEIFVSIVFSVEYVLRVLTADLLYPGIPKWKAMLRYMRSGMAIIDLLAVMPFYLPMIFTSNLLAIRIFRLMRILRILKLNRYFESLATIGAVIRSKSRELIGSMIVVGLLLVISSLLIYAAEHEAQPKQFSNAFSGLWWAVATLTTVGYGDIYPVTIMGKILGAMIALLGIGMVAIPTGILSSALVEHMNLQNKDEESDDAEKTGDYTFCPHCGKKLK